MDEEIKMTLTQAYPFRFAVFSMISLLAGVLYLVAVLPVDERSQHT